MFVVLIVEDEMIIRKNLINCIDWKTLDCQVCFQASSGEEGLEIIVKKHPDIVITDINLPGMNGIEMLEKGREFADFSSIIITGYSLFDYAKKAIALSVAEYILKPIDEEELRQAIIKVKETIKEKREFESLRHKIESGFTIDQFDMCTNDIYLKKLYSIIRMRYNEHLSIEEISSQIGLSSGYLCRKIKDETGMSFLTLLQQHRIEKAQFLINENPNIKYYEIAEMVGFSSYKRFSEVFRKVSGRTASEHEINQ